MIGLSKFEICRFWGKRLIFKITQIKSIIQIFGDEN